jgi:hypothetical protein
MDSLDDLFQAVVNGELTVAEAFNRLESVDEETDTENLRKLHIAERRRVAMQGRCRQCD